MALSRYAQRADVPNRECDHGLTLASCVTCIKLDHECDYGSCLAAPTHILTQSRDGRALENRPMCEHHARTCPATPGIELTVRAREMQEAA